MKTQECEAYTVPNTSPTTVIFDECNPPINDQYENIK